MNPTRRYWEVIGVAFVLLLSAVAFDQPMLFAGSAVLFGWLIAMQIAFVAALTTLDTTVTVDQSLGQTATVIDEPVTLTLTATGDVEGVEATIRLQPPAGVEIVGTKRIALGETTAVAVKSRIAGTHTFSAPEVTVTDTRGLFIEQLTRGSSCEVTIQPREPKQVHIGEGGDAIPIAFGEHAVDTGESGLIPAELQEYTGTESIARIDWKATARLSTPYIREFEAESNVTTILVFDRRERVTVGSDGETAFHYLRSAALSYLAVVQSLGDPIGCFSIADDHVEEVTTPTNSAHGYELLRRRVQAMTVQTASPTHHRRPVSLHHRSPMLDQETTFGQTLATYTNTATATPTADPMSAAVRRAGTTHQGTIQLALFTDDSDHAELRNAVAEAKQANVRLTVFMAPRVLYESPTAIGTDTADEQYQAFERFRRQLAAIEGVTAYEVAPRERIERILEAQPPTTTS